MDVVSAVHFSEHIIHDLEAMAPYKIFGAPRILKLDTSIAPFKSSSVYILHKTTARTGFFLVCTLVRTNWSINYAAMIALVRDGVQVSNFD